MTNRERISGVDTAWLRMDQPANLMMIVGVLVFDRRLGLRRLKRLLQARFLAFPRLRQRPVLEAGSAWWEPCEPLDLDRHVRAISLPAPAGKRELETLVSQLASTPLDADAPLWHFHLVEDYEGGSAVVARIHHCYADGIALIQVMLSLTDTSPEAGEALPEAPPAAPGPPPADSWAQVLGPVAGAFQGAVQLLDGGRQLAAHPRQAAGAAQDLALKGVGLAAEVARLALMGRDAATRFKGPLGPHKRAAWARPLPLAEVKAVGRALGCSINDILLSLAAGALRDYLAEKGDPVEGLEIRAIVPVNLRPAGEPASLGNRFGLVFLDLPLGMDHPLERLYEVRRRMRALKDSWQPAIALGLLAAVGYGPRVLQEQVTSLLAASASAVITNVPGPQQPLYLAGRRIVELEFWVPQAGGIGLGLSILSYDGRIHFGIIADEGLVPDPHRIVDRFAGEFDRLLWLTLMSPWGEEAVPAAAAPGTASPPERAPARRARASGRRRGKSAARPPKVPRRFRSL